VIVKDCIIRLRELGITHVAAPRETRDNLAGMANSGTVDAIDKVVDSVLLVKVRNNTPIMYKIHYPSGSCSLLYPDRAYGAPASARQKSKASGCSLRQGKRSPPHVRILGGQ